MEYCLSLVLFTLQSFSRTLSFILISTSFLSLLLAYIGQHFFGLFPCKLCLYERIPYFGLLGANVLTFYFSAFRKWVNWVNVFFVLLGIALSGWHVLTEWGVVAEKCASATKHATPDALLDSLVNNTHSCASPTIILFNFSMAELNFILSLLLLLVCFMGVKYAKKQSN